MKRGHSYIVAMEMSGKVFIAFVCLPLELCHSRFNKRHLKFLPSSSTEFQCSISLSIHKYTDMYIYAEKYNRNTVYQLLLQVFWGSDNKD